MDFRFAFLETQPRTAPLGRDLPEQHQCREDSPDRGTSIAVSPVVLQWRTAPVQPSFSGCAIKTRKSRVQTMLRGLSPKLVKPVTGLRGSFKPPKQPKAPKLEPVSVRLGWGRHSAGRHCLGPPSHYLCHRPHRTPPPLLPLRWEGTAKSFQGFCLGFGV